MSPSEPTTITGRRWKAAVTAAATEKGIVSSPPKAVLDGPANTYAHYAVMNEEYRVSTLYGPWHSAAFIYLSTSNIEYLKAGNTPSPPPGPSPPNNADNSLSLINGVVFDNQPLGKSFSEVLTQPQSNYTKGAVVTTSFISANPRNNLRQEDTVVAVEKLVDGTRTM